MKLLILITYVVASVAQIQISTVPENVPIIFNKLAIAHTTYEAYRLVYYVNLTDFYQLQNLAQKAILLANETCSKATYDQCEISISQLQTQLQNAIRDDELIKAERKKRSICDWWFNTTLFIRNYGLGTCSAIRKPNQQNYSRN